MHVRVITRVECLHIQDQTKKLLPLLRMQSVFVLDSVRTLLPPSTPPHLQTVTAGSNPSQQLLYLQEEWERGTRHQERPFFPSHLHCSGQKGSLKHVVRTNGELQQKAFFLGVSVRLLWGFIHFDNPAGRGNWRARFSHVMATRMHEASYVRHMPKFRCVIRLMYMCDMTYGLSWDNPAYTWQTHSDG